MTQRGKTTPASTQGSWAPHAGRSSRAEPATDGDVEMAESWDAYYDKHGTPQFDDERAALNELRNRGINGHAASLAATNIRPTQMIELDDAGVPLNGHGPALSKKIPIAEITDAQTHGIDLYEYDRARSGGILDSHRLHFPPDHQDVINAHKAGANLAAFGLLTGHGISPVEATEAARNQHMPPTGYLDLRQDAGCTHSEAMEVANAVTHDGYMFQAQTTYRMLRESGATHAQIVQALSLAPEHDPTGISTLFNYRTLLWDHSHDTAITHLADAG